MPFKCLKKFASFVVSKISPNAKSKSFLFVILEPHFERVAANRGFDVSNGIKVVATDDVPHALLRKSLLCLSCVAVHTPLLKGGHEQVNYDYTQVFARRGFKISTYSLRQRLDSLQSTKAVSLKELLRVLEA